MMVNEQVWLTERDPLRLLEYLHFGGDKPRKQVLFSIACCRLMWESLDQCTREGVLAVEQSEAMDWSAAGDRDLFDRDLQWREIGSLWLKTFLVQGSTPNPVYYSRVCEIIRDVFGNPFRQVVIEPACVTPAIHDLASSIYERNEFHRLPLLAEDLAIAGCKSTELLSHCRDGCFHVRGCWAMDQILGKH